jgi:hypothetical protein
MQLWSSLYAVLLFRIIFEVWSSFMLTLHICNVNIKILFICECVSGQSPYRVLLMRPWYWFPWELLSQKDMLKWEQTPVAAASRSEELCLTLPLKSRYTLYELKKKNDKCSDFSWCLFAVRCLDYICIWRRSQLFCTLFASSCTAASSRSLLGCRSGHLPILFVEKGIHLGR